MPVILCSLFMAKVTGRRHRFFLSFLLFLLLSQILTTVYMFSSQSERERERERDKPDLTRSYFPCPIQGKGAIDCGNVRGKWRRNSQEEEKKEKKGPKKRRERRIGLRVASVIIRPVRISSSAVAWGHLIARRALANYAFRVRVGLISRIEPSCVESQSEVCIERGLDSALL